MYSITFKSDSKDTLEYLRETAYERDVSNKYETPLEEMTVEQLDDMIDEPKKARSQVAVCNNCGSDFLGTEALVDDNNEVVAGPYDNTQCLYCGAIDASVRVIPIEQAQECANAGNCMYMASCVCCSCCFDEKVMKNGLCPMCADPSLENGTVWNLKENN